MSVHVIKVGRGLQNRMLPDVTSPGFMRYLRNLVYRAHDQESLYKIDGRSQYADLSLSYPLRGAGVWRGPSYDQVILACGGNLYTASATETSPGVQIGSGYNPAAFWRIYNKGGLTFLTNGVDDPLVYDGTTLGPWGISPPAAAPNDLPSGSGSFGPSSFFDYTFTFARIVNGVVVYQSDPPFISGVLQTRRWTGPDTAKSYNRISTTEMLPTWATHYVWYRTTDGGTTLLQIGTSTSPSFDDSTPSAAESPGTVLETDHQVAPVCSGMMEFAGKMVVWGMPEYLTQIAYSIAGQPFHFPLDATKVESGWVHRIGLEEGGSRFVRGVVRVSKGLICGMDDGLVFVEKLPDESDPLFEEAYSVRMAETVGAIHSEDGFLGNFAWDTLRLSGDEDVVFFPSLLGRGFCMSDGQGAMIVSPGFDWTEKVVNPDLLDQIVVVNNVREMRMEVYCASPSATENDQAFFYHYGPGHIVGQVAGYPVGKISGPHPRAVSCAVMTKILAQKRMLTGASQATGKVYISGGVNDAGAAISLKGRTAYATFPAKITEAQVYQVWPIFRGEGNYSYTLTVEMVTGEGERQTVSESFDGAITSDAGSDAYGGSTVQREEMEARALTINLTGRMMMISLENAQIDSDLALSGFAVELEPAGTAKAVS